MHPLKEDIEPHSWNTILRLRIEWKSQVSSHRTILRGLQSLPWVILAQPATSVKQKQILRWYLPAVVYTELTRSYYGMEGQSLLEAN